MPQTPRSSDIAPTPPRIVVIGAGAAGMLAAAEASERGADVVLLEKNSKTGVKILMSGGTRCNITQHTDPRGIANAFGKSGRFLHHSVGGFGPADVVAMFHRHGVETKIEPTGKIFPKSDRAVHVRDALHRRMIDAGVKLHLRSAVHSLEKQSDSWSVRTSDGALTCDNLIVTSGGKSWPKCGTTGDAYGWLERLGHTIVRPRPALVPLVGGEKWTHELSGLTIQDSVATVHATIGRKRKPIIRRRAGWLFTHFGFSGPAPMDVSGTLTAADSFDELTLSVDLLPDLAKETILDELSDRSGGGRRSVQSVIARWLPGRLAEALVRRQHADVSIAELPRKRLLSLADTLKGVTLPVTGTRGFEKAEVTAGGVELSEVDPRTMASRIVPGLYIAGEVLNLDGWIGGYNFQAAFSTGRAAGIAASEPPPN